jgi:hypothetical protein
VYAAENTIELQANTPEINNLSNIPYRLKNSPKKFKDKGVPAFPKHNIKNNIENKGINCAEPL